MSGDVDAHDRLPRLHERFGQRILIGIGRGREAEIREHAIGAVARGIADRLEIDRDDRLAVLAGRLRDQLFEPRAEADDARRGDQRELVASLRRGDAEQRAEREAGILITLDAGAARRGHARGAREERVDVEADHRRGHESERRQRGIASADRRLAEEDVTEAVAFRDLLHLRAGIGDRDEVLSGVGRADRADHAFEEILLEDVRFERAAGFAGDDDERAGEVDAGFDGAHLRGHGGIEHVQLGESWLLAERGGEHFRSEARAAHAEQERVREFLGADFIGQRAELVEILLLAADGVEPSEPLRLVLIGPDGCVARPQARHAAVFLPGRDLVAHGAGERVRRLPGQCVHRRFAH